MAHLIDKDALVAEIEKRRAKYINSFMTEQVHVLNDVLDFIDTLEVKEVYVSNPQFPHLKDIIDKVFGAGNLEFWEYDDAEQLVLLAKDEVISQVCEVAGMKKPYKDGNQWCILKGENIQEGICGFGDNIEDALIDFLRNIPKIPLEVKEVDINKEISQFIDANFEKAKIGHKLSLRYTAKYFFEFGMQQSKNDNNNEEKK